MVQKSTAAGFGSWFINGAFIGPFVFPVFVSAGFLISGGVAFHVCFRF